MEKAWQQELVVANHMGEPQGPPPVTHFPSESPQRDSKSAGDLVFKHKSLLGIFRTQNSSLLIDTSFSKYLAHIQAKNTPFLFAVLPYNWVLKTRSAILEQCTNIDCAKSHPSLFKRSSPSMSCTCNATFILSPRYSPTSQVSPSSTFLWQDKSLSPSVAFHELVIDHW